MRAIIRFTAGISLAATSLAFQPVTAVADINWPAVDADTNPSFHDVRSAHPPTAPKTSEGLRGSEGIKGETGMAGAQTAKPDINQAYEDYSGTHSTPPAAAKTNKSRPQGHGK
jgi:hypothetical protein